MHSPSKYHQRRQLADWPLTLRPPARRMHVTARLAGGGWHRNAVCIVKKAPQFSQSCDRSPPRLRHTMGSRFSSHLPLCSGVALECFASGNDLCVSISAKDKPARGPAHCILVLDISGSMESEASLPNAAANSGEARVRQRTPPLTARLAARCRTSSLLLLAQRSYSLAWTLQSTHR